MRVEGICAPIVPRCRADVSCNEAARAETVAHLLSVGVHEIIVAASTTNDHAQTEAERICTLTRCAELIAGRVPMVVGTGAIRTGDSLRPAQACKAVGADALLVATPPYAYPMGRAIAPHCLAVDRAVNLQAMRGNHPGRMSVNMDNETLDRLGRAPDFRAITESSGDTDRLHRLARDDPKIAPSCGMNDRALEFFARGARSLGLRGIEPRARGASGAPPRLRAGGRCREGPRDHARDAARRGLHRRRAKPRSQAGGRGCTCPSARMC